MRLYLLAAMLIVAAAPARADESDSDLATKLSNPVASLISFPLQFNYDCCYGPKGSDRVLLNVQPVVPFQISEDWNLIVRTILPVIDQQELFAGAGSHFGFGDITQSFFFSPISKPGEIIWAVGPAFLYPTATDPMLGSHKWGLGPTGLILKQQAGWTYGALVNHIWSYGGEGEYPNVSATFIQPFVGYTWPDTTGLTFNMENSYNWQAEQWTVPLNLSLSHLFKLGSQRVSMSFGGRYYAVRPDQTASWGLRFTMTFVFPE